MSGETELVGLIFSARWRKATNWVAKKPHEVREYRSEGGPTQGSTVLHLACSLDPPVKLVTALLDAFPEATSVQNLLGFTPLHYASRYASHMVVKTLLKADITAINMKATGNLSPLKLLCLKYGARIQETLNRPYIYESHLEGTVFCFKSKADQLIKAEYHNTTSDHLPKRKSFRMLHACAGLRDCPASLLLFAIKVHPEQLAQGDEDGNLPLHIAAKTFGAGNVSKGNFKVIDCLVRAYPAAAQVHNSAKKLPIHLAILSGKEWHEGLESIYNAYPAVITERDTRSDLYPFMLSAVGGRASISTVYQLFRACPEIERLSYRDREACSRITKRLKRKCAASMKGQSECSTVVTRSMRKRAKIAHAE